MENGKIYFEVRKWKTGRYILRLGNGKQEDIF